MAFSTESSGSVRMARALYDYEYEDDQNELVTMIKGEIYHLLNSDSEDWWHVRRPNTLASFYVPRTYVEIFSGDQIGYCSQEEINDNGFSGSQGSFGQENNLQSVKMQVKSESSSNIPSNGLKSFKPQMEDNNESLYINYNSGGKNVTNIQVHYVGKAQRPTDFGYGDGGEYANLEDLRLAAGINQPVSDKSSDQSPDSDYANLQQLHIEPPPTLIEPASPPLPEQSKYQKTIMSKWDMYLDPTTNRVFYVHKDTKERNWKPPRDKDLPGTFHHELYKQRMAGENSPTSPTEDRLDSLQKSQSSSTLTEQRPEERSKVSDRFRKTRSVMIENLQFHAPPANSTGPPPPKSATLPSNFQAPIPEIEPIEGIILKAKIEKGGKPGKKSSSYVKLEGTNLVFHQILKRSKPGAIDYMVPLQTCTVEKNPKEFSKKNSILVSTEDPASQTLLMYEDEAKMLEWFLRLQMKIKEVGGPAELPPAQLPVTPSEVVRKPSFKNKKGHSRTDSKTDNSANKSSLKDFLQTFLIRRKNLTEIQEKGIYKNAVFGAELKQLCDKEKVKVPIFITNLVEAIEKRGLDHEGIYRIGGNISQIQKLRCMVDQDEPYNLDDPTWDTNVLTGALKLFFRELKEPLFTFALFDKFLSNYMKELNSERLKGVRNTMHDLPKCHYETVKFLFKHLTKVMEESKENKMQAHQLAIVFGPTLIWPQVQSPNLATSMVYQSRIVEYVLLEYKNIFR